MVIQTIKYTAGITPTGTERSNVRKDIRHGMF